MKTRTQSPHILFLYVDQMRWDCMGCAGNKDIKTPALDALRQDSVLFNESFCTYPICTPSRYSLLTGRDPHEHRGWSNHSTILPDLPTFPRLLQEGGYHTKAIGKMHYTPTYADVGYQEMELCEQDGDGRWEDDYHQELMRHGLCDFSDLEDQRMECRKLARRTYWETFGALPSTLPEPWHSTSWIADKAEKALAQWTPDRAEFCIVSFVKPHHPHDYPQTLADRYDPSALALPPYWTDALLPRDREFRKGYFDYSLMTEANCRAVMAAYYANISHIDEKIGRLIRQLKESGLYDKTLIVFTSDHGEYLGHHHLLLKGNHMYDPIMRVPLLIKFPHAAGAGRTDDRLVCNLDIAPTILGAAGIPAPESMRGFDLAQPGVNRDVIHGATLVGKELMSRSKSYKLLLNGEDRERSLFFDLQSDPGEFNNLWSSPDGALMARRTAMEAGLRDWLGAGYSGSFHLDEDAPAVIPARLSAGSDSETIKAKRAASIEETKTYYRAAYERWSEDRHDPKG